MMFFSIKADYVPDIDELRVYIMFEFHNSRYSINVGSMKMYQNLIEAYLWNAMKRILKILCLSVLIVNKLCLKIKGLVD